jgi:uncharacterized protein (DUF2342 family)
LIAVDQTFSIEATFNTRGAQSTLAQLEALRPIGVLVNKTQQRQASTSATQQLQALMALIERDLPIDDAFEAATDIVLKLNRLEKDARAFSDHSGSYPVAVK